MNNHRLPLTRKILRESLPASPKQSQGLTPVKRRKLLEQKRLHEDYLATATQIKQEAEETLESDALADQHEYYKSAYRNAKIYTRINLGSVILNTVILIVNILLWNISPMLILTSCVIILMIVCYKHSSKNIKKYNELVEGYERLEEICRENIKMAIEDIAKYKEDIKAIDSQLANIKSIPTAK